MGSFYSIKLNTMEHMVLTLKWVQSYFSNRLQFVTLFKTLTLTKLFNDVYIYIHFLKVRCFLVIIIKCFSPPINQLMLI